jgi:hypothetical protein
VEPEPAVAHGLFKVRRYRPQHLFALSEVSEMGKPKHRATIRLTHYLRAEANPYDLSCPAGLVFPP